MNNKQTKGRFWLGPWFCCNVWFKDGFGCGGPLSVIPYVFAKFLHLFSAVQVGKALHDQQPISIFVHTGTPAWYMTIAIPLLAKWRPIRSAENPKVSLPLVVVADLTCLNSIRPVMRHFFPLSKHIFTWVCLCVFRQQNWHCIIFCLNFYGT